MERVFLFGNKMTSKHQAHIYIKESFNFPDYYGENLDALWDLLTSRSTKIAIFLLHEEELYKNLGEYGKQITGVFREATDSNDNIQFYNIY